MKKTITTITAAALVLGMSACSSSDEWESEGVRDAAFREYACQTMQEGDVTRVGGTAIRHMQDVPEGGPRAHMLNTSYMITAGTIEPTCDESKAEYNADMVDAWIKHEEIVSGEDFTPSVARERGIIE